MKEWDEILKLLREADQFLSKFARTEADQAEVAELRFRISGKLSERRMTVTPVASEDDGTARLTIQNPGDDTNPKCLEVRAESIYACDPLRISFDVGRKGYIVEQHVHWVFLKEGEEFGDLSLSTTWQEVGFFPSFATTTFTVPKGSL